VYFYDWFKGKSIPYQILKFAVLAVLAIVIALQVQSYLTEYYTEYPVYSAFGYWGFEYGNQEMLEFTESVKHNYEWIGVTGKLHQAYSAVLFYTAHDPAEYHSRTNYRQIGKYRVGFALDREYRPGNYLYVVRPEELSSEYDYEVLHTVYAPDGMAISQIVEIHNRRQAS
jgi:hypothetical protein